MRATQTAQTGPPPPHPLEVELANLFATDPRMWGFLQAGSLDGIWYWDLENPSEEWMSPEFWRLFGIDPDTKRHDPAEWQDIIFPDDLATAVKNFQKHCNNPNHPYDQIVRYRHADGSTVWVRCRGIAIRNDQGRAIRMLGAHTDLTAAKRAEEQALHALKKLELANADLQSFAYGVSHDLKSPARTALQLIEEGINEAPDRLSDIQTDLFTDACAMLRRMQTLIEDLLGYGHLIEQQMQWAPVDLATVAKHAAHNIDAQRRDRDGLIEIGPMVCVTGHQAQLQMLLQNLMLNAVKYHRPGIPPKVQVSATLDPASKTTILRVSDNGCGIPAEHMSRIFEVFARLHRQDQVSGSGLGLALCNRIATNHNAIIHVTSTPGEGSVFEVHFHQRFSQ